MSRKSRANKAIAPEVITPEVPQDAIVVADEVVADAIIDAAIDAVAEPVFNLTVTGDTRLKAKRGFETVLLAELRRGGGTAKALVARMLESGEYAKAAPKAAEHRPMKPVAYILKIWKSAGYVVVDIPLALEIPEEALAIA